MKKPSRPESAPKSPRPAPSDVLKTIAGGIVSPRDPQTGSTGKP